MLETTLMIKVQTILPKDIREGLNLSAGDRIMIVMLNVAGLAAMLPQEQVRHMTAIRYDHDGKSLLNRPPPIR